RGEPPDQCMCIEQKPHSLFRIWRLLPFVEFFRGQRLEELRPDGGFPAQCPKHSLRFAHQRNKLGNRRAPACGDDLLACFRACDQPWLVLAAWIVTVSP